MALLTYNELHTRVVDAGVLVGVPFENVNGSSIDITLGPTLLVERKPEVRCPHCLSPVSNIPVTLLMDSHLVCLGGSTTDVGNVPVMPDMHLMAKIFPHLTLPCNVCENRSPLHFWVEEYSPVDFSKKEQIKFETIDCTNGYVLQPGEVCLASTNEIFNMPMDLTAEYRLKSSMARVFIEHLHASWCDPGWHNAQLTLEFANMSRHHPLMLRAGEKCGQVMFYSGEPVPEDRSYAARGQYNHQRDPTQSKGSK